MQAPADIFEGAFFIVVLSVISVMAGLSVQADNENINIAMEIKLQGRKNPIGISERTINNGWGESVL